MSEVEKQPVRTGAQPQSASRVRAAEANAIRPFRVHFSDEALAEPQLFSQEVRAAFRSLR